MKRSSHQRIQTFHQISFIAPCDDGTATHSFQTLLRGLQTVVRDTCRTPDSASDAPTLQPTTTRDEEQKRAVELIAKIKT
ncbi:MAG: hypothetical protein ACOYNZ_14275 [Rhodoferax sp.]